MVSHELNVTQGSPGTDWWRICCTVSVNLKICSPLVLRFESHRSSALGSSADTTAAPCLMTKSNCMSTGGPALALRGLDCPCHINNTMRWPGKDEQQTVPEMARWSQKHCVEREVTFQFSVPVLLDSLIPPWDWRSWSHSKNCVQCGEIKFSSSIF